MANILIDKLMIDSITFIPGDIPSQNESIITARSAGIITPIKLHYVGKSSGKVCQRLYKGQLLDILGEIFTITPEDKCMHIKVYNTIVIQDSVEKIANRIRSNIKALEKQGRLPPDAERMMFGWPGQCKSIEALVRGEDTL